MKTIILVLAVLLISGCTENPPQATSTIDHSDNFNFIETKFDALDVNLHMDFDNYTIHSKKLIYNRTWETEHENKVVCNNTNEKLILDNMTLGDIFICTPLMITHWEAYYEANVTLIDDWTSENRTITCVLTIYPPTYENMVVWESVMKSLKEGNYINHEIGYAEQESLNKELDYMCELFD